MSENVVDLPVVKVERWEDDQSTGEWRVRYLMEAARRLDVHIKKLKIQAADYRKLAEEISSKAAK
jgi:hypothetical protein